MPAIGESSRVGKSYVQPTSATSVSPTRAAQYPLVTPLYGHSVTVSDGEQVLEVNLRAVEVVTGRKAGLEHHHGRGRVGEDGPLELDPYAAG